MIRVRLFLLRHHLSNHIVETAYEKGWSNLKNGALLTQAEVEGFDVLITTDQNLRYQQNLADRNISVVVLLTTSWPQIKNNVAMVIEAIDNLHPNSYKEIDFP